MCNNILEALAGQLLISITPSAAAWVLLLWHHHSESPVVALARPVDVIQHFNAQHEQRQEEPNELLTDSKMSVW